MLYLAFGSNLDPDQMRARCPAHKQVGMAVLHDHKLIFPIFSTTWGGGAASLQLSHGNEVWGVLYELNDEDLRSLDGHEGFRGPGDAHNLYERGPVWVELTHPEDGSVPRRVKAAAYLAHTANPSPPSRTSCPTTASPRSRGCRCWPRKLRRNRRRRASPRPGRTGRAAPGMSGRIPR
jgi:hypothetical protein